MSPHAEAGGNPVLERLWTRRKTILGVTAGVLAIGIAYTLWVPPVWEAKATLLFPVRSSSLSALGGIMEGTGLSTSLMGGPTPLKIFGGILKSERALEYVCQNSDLGRRKVMDMRDLTDQASENSLSISVRDRDPEFAKRVVRLHIEALDRINSDVTAPLFVDDTGVLEERIREQQKAIREKEAELLKFQNGALTAPSVTSSGSGKEAALIASPSRWRDQQRSLEIELGRVNSTLQAAQKTARQAAGSKGRLPSQLPPVVKWRDRLTELEYDLQIRQLTLAPESPEIRKLKESIALTRGQMESEIGRYMKSLDVNGLDPGNGTSIPSLLGQRVGLEAQIKAVSQLAGAAPAESIQMTRLMRELTSRTAILQQLQSQYEIARVQAARNPNKWEVLDQPWVDEKPVNKGLVRASAASIFAGLFLGSAIALMTGRKPKKVRAENSDDALPLAA